MQNQNKPSLKFRGGGGGSSCAFTRKMLCKAGFLSITVTSVQVLRSLTNSPRVGRERFADACKLIVGAENVSRAPSTLEQHSHDESFHRAGLPDIVVWPTNVTEVSNVAKLCSSERVPMIPYGTGTGLEGGVAPMQGGVCINLTKMDQITDLHIEDFDVTVQPGVTRKSLNNYLKDTGLWFPVDPGADASLCGMASTSASGTNAVRYGTMKENVINLEVVLADGRIIHTSGKGRRFKKSAAGYNLTSLFVGSEGTLGLITSATLRLHPLSECTLSAVCPFPTMEDAVTCCVNVIQAGIPIARMEYLDEISIDAANKYSQLSNPLKPTLFFEFHGSENGAKEQVEATEEITSANNGLSFVWAETQEERNKLWKARHDILYAVLAQSPGTRAYSTDVCVPISRLPEAVMYASERAKNCGLPFSVVGHVGDGNFHVLLCVDPSNEQDMKLLSEVGGDIAKNSLSLGGTCTGEHGVGIGKRYLLTEEVGTGGIEVMKSIKDALDPMGLMNPGKIFC